MTIEVHVQGLSKTQFKVNANETDTIELVKQKLHQDSDAPCPLIQKLILDGKELRDDQTLKDVGYVPSSTITLVKRKSEQVVDAKQLKKLQTIILRQIILIQKISLLLQAIWI